MSTRPNEKLVGINVDAGSESSLRKLVEQMSGERLPAERDLAKALKISRPRLRAILAQLQNEGLIESRRGSGTYSMIDRPRPGLRRILILVDARLKLGDDPFFSALFERLQSKIQVAGIRCSMERTSGRVPLAFPEDAALTLGLAGEALVGAQRPDDPPLAGLLLPEHVRPNRRASVIQLFDRDAGVAAAHRLLGQGCRRILFVGRRDIASSDERYHGAASACVGWSGGCEITHVESHLNYAAGLRIGREIAREIAGGATGIIATNDWLAVGLRLGLQQRAERFVQAHGPIPIVSFDGLPLTADPSLQIDSLALPLDAIAGDAIAELQRLHAGALGRVLRYPLDFGIRDSAV